MSVKISLITVCYNAEKSIERCIQSVLRQKHSALEHIVIDGASSDGTVQKLQQFTDEIDILISERDRGPYDAMNKGLDLASGDVVGFLHADDQLSNRDILNRIADRFASKPNIDAVYGDLNFYDRYGHCVRRWNSSNFDRKRMRAGWMPAHPTFYMRKTHYDEGGGFDPSYGSAADYELMLRYLYTRKISAEYIPGELVKMQIGGLSNRSVSNRLKANWQDYRAMKQHKLPFPSLALVAKISRKIGQWF